MGPAGDSWSPASFTDRKGLPSEQEEALESGLRGPTVAGVWISAVTRGRQGLEQEAPGGSRDVVTV